MVFVWCFVLRYFGTYCPLSAQIKCKTVKIDCDQTPITTKLFKLSDPNNNNVRGHVVMDIAQ